MCGGYVCTNCGKCENVPAVRQLEGEGICKVCGALLGDDDLARLRCSQCGAPLIAPPGASYRAVRRDS